MTPAAGPPVRRRFGLAVLAGLSLVAAVALASPPVGAADWRATFRVLRVGLLAGPSPGHRIAQAEPFRAHLAGRLGVPVEVVPAVGYEALIDALTGERIHYAVLSASAFATAEALCRCVEALAVPLAADGAPGFFSVLLARADGPASLAEAKGVRLAAVRGDSVAGRLVPFRSWAEEGIDPTSHFAAIREVASPEEAIALLASGDVDVALAWSSLTGSAAQGFGRGPLADLVRRGTASPDGFKVIWRSTLIANGPHVVRSDLAPEPKALLKAALLAMNAEAPEALDAVDRAGGGGFAAAEREMFAAVRRLVAPERPAAR